jgi:O-antigen ligase
MADLEARHRNDAESSDSGCRYRRYEAANATTANSWKAAHNAYIQIGVELGIGGILAFLLAIRGALLSGWKVRSMSTPSGDESDDKLAFDRMLATAALCSLIGELTRRSSSRWLTTR